MPLILRNRRINSLFIVPTAAANCADKIALAVDLDITEQIFALQHKVNLWSQYQKVNLCRGTGHAFNIQIVQHNHIHTAVFQLKQNIILTDNTGFHHGNLFCNFFRVFSGCLFRQLFQLPQILLCVAGFLRNHNLRF